MKKIVLALAMAVATAAAANRSAITVQTQMDSVWDVAPSPDWKWIAFGRAYAVVRGEGTGTDLLADVALAKLAGGVGTVTSFDGFHDGLKLSETLER